MPTTDINVVFADDHRRFRHTVRRLLDSAGDIHVVYEAEDGQQALSAVCDRRPDVAILDLDMPGKDGLEVATSVRDLRLPVKTILLTAHKSQALVTRAQQCGVSGYLLKEDLAELIDCIRAVHAGHGYLSALLRS
jgi:DNA-binding NarL/FixJ family response regulator